MEIIYNNSLSPEEYLYLVSRVGWKDLNESQVQRGIKNSMFVVSARDGERIVGMARLVGDFGCHGLITDVIVDPQYQGRGIGTNLVNNIKEHIYSFLKKDEKFLVELLPSCGKRDFYIKLGFKYKPENMDGMYLWFEK